MTLKTIKLFIQIHPINIKYELKASKKLNMTL